MPHLRPFSLLTPQPKPRPSERITLPDLRQLKYRGTSQYLDSLAARIDAPRLGDIDIAFLNQHLPMELHQLGQFINLTTMHESHRRADIIFSKRAISISFTQPESSTCLELQVPCKSFSQQLSHLTRICECLYLLLPGIEHLRVCATRNDSGHESHDYKDREEWQKVLLFFRGKKWAYIACGLSTDTIISLLRSRQRPKLFPALHKLYIQEPGPLWQEAIVSFIHSRLLSGHIIAVEYERLRINELHRTGTGFF